MGARTSILGVVVALVVACSEGEIGGGAGGSGANAGSAGAASGGQSGAGATGGSSSAGAGGSSGSSAGTGGSAGSAGGGGSAGTAGEAGSGGAAGGGASAIWINAYYAAWMQATLPPSEIDFSAVTQLTHFSFTPNGDGSLNTTDNGMTAAKSAAVIAAAHAAGKQVLISIGGAGTHAGFQQAISASKRDGFVQALVTEALARGYDGIDVDMEPIEAGDVSNFVAFVKALRIALDQAAPGKLLTTAASSTPVPFVQLVAELDQINVMTYDLSGAWPGWETWHNSALFDGGLVFQSTGAPLPSCDGIAKNWAAAGIPKHKLGIGIDFYGYVWNGANGPNQSIAGVSVDANVSYSQIMSTYFSSGAKKWHDAAQAPYLSIGSAGSASAKFVSYDDEQSCQKKIEYVKSEGLGGLIIWELGGGYLPSAPAGQRDPLLQAVRSAAFGP
jgi:chitinase